MTDHSITAPAGKTPVVSVKDGAVYTNSRDVAEYFGKNHRDVLRDADNILKNIDCAKLRSGLFLQAMLPDAQGIGRRVYDMTKDGFTLLVMGYTGAKAMAFKVAYIQRFNEMEAALHPAGLGLSVDRIARRLDELASQVNDMIVTADARVAALDYVSVRELLDEAGALTKGRNRLNRRIGHDLRTRALLRQPPVPVRRCPHSGVWLFPRDFTDHYMVEHGRMLVQDHNAAVMGQGVLRFPQRGRPPSAPTPPDGEARP